MIYLIQWGDNMAEKNGFEKGLALGLAMGGLSVSGGTEIVEKEIEKIIYANSPFYVGIANVFTSEAETDYLKIIEEGGIIV